MCSGIDLVKVNLLLRCAVFSLVLWCKYLFQEPRSIKNRQIHKFFTIYGNNTLAWDYHIHGRSKKSSTYGGVNSKKNLRHSVQYFLFQVHSQYMLDILKDCKRACEITCLKLTGLPNTHQKDPKTLYHKPDNDKRNNKQIQYPFKYKFKKINKKYDCILFYFL